jgi:hypothetical protein
MDTTANAVSPPTKTGHVEVRGVNYYYEIRGKGEPLLLLHGGLGSIDMFGPNLAILSANREVIAVDTASRAATMQNFVTADAPPRLWRHGSVGESRSP